MIKLRPVLKNLEINQIVSIDDDNRNGIEQFGGKEIDSCLGLVELEDAENQFLYDSGFQTISELQESEEVYSKTILKKIADYFVGRQTQESSLLWLEDTISEINSQSLKYVKLSKLSEIANVDKKNTLWILDKDMNGKDSVFQAITLIKNHLQENVNIFMIFTHEQLMKELNQDWFKRFQYLIDIGFSENEAKQLAYELYVICKPENPMKPEKAVFKEVVFNSIIGHTINAIFINIKNAKNDMLVQFENFTKQVNFERLRTFRYNLENEGEHNIYKLMNGVMNLMEIQNYQNYMKQGVNYINVFKKIISSSQAKSLKEEQMQTLELINQQYLWNRYQYIDVDINIGYEDICFGDVFQLELSSFYKRKFGISDQKVIGVLITQSCDCVVRKDTGKRKKNMLELLLFKEQNTIEEDKCSDLYQNAIFLFNYDNNTPNSYIHREQILGVLHIDASVLDLCSLNCEGEAYLLSDESLKNEIELKKPIEWNEQEAMYDNLKEEQIVENSPLDKRLIEERHGLEYCAEKRKFAIKRLGRLSYNNAHIILNGYINNIARVGKDSPSTIRMQDY